MANRQFSDHIFFEDADYDRLISGAHRRAITPIISPSLARHVGLWDRSPPNETGDQAAASQGEKLAGRADNALVALYLHLRDDTKCHGVTKASVKLNNEFSTDDGTPLYALFNSVIDKDGRTYNNYHPDSYRALKLSFEWQKLPVTLSFEVHTEMVTISYLIDGSRKPDEPHDAKPDSILEKLRETLCAIGQNGCTDYKAHRTFHGVLFAEIWNAFDRQIMSGAKPALGDLGPKFLDFRGVLLGVASHAKPSLATRVSSWLQGGDELNPPFQPPFSRTDPDHRPLERSSYCTVEAFKILTHLLRDANPEGTELTASRFLTDRAFYVTALGEQGMPKPLANGKRRPAVGATGTPLCYIVYEDTLNKWQLGRLIYRLQRAGTMRVAATMYFDDLHNAAGRLSEIEQFIDDTLAEITTMESNGQSSHRTRRYGTDQYRESEKLVSDALRWSSSSSLPNNPLDYRIERSRYYVDQFHRVAKALRSERVGGFQPYPDFVEQRLGPAYDYIAAIGARYARVQERREFLRGRLQRIDAIMDQKAITLAQAGGDIALGILVPYYLAHTLIETHAFSDATEQPVLWKVLAFLGAFYIVVQLFRAIATESPDGLNLRAFLFDAIRQAHLGLRIAYFACFAGLTAIAVLAAWPLLSAAIWSPNGPGEKAQKQEKRRGSLPPEGQQPKAGPSSPSPDNSGKNSTKSKDRTKGI